ncbi:MAG: hypothetical protein MJE77_43385 [Proteobacteria bacterium]|nr:hypothetical protein [Pseudomonadota bacterium]
MSGVGVEDRDLGAGDVASQVEMGKHAGIVGEVEFLAGWTDVGDKFSAHIGRCVAVARTS